MSTAISRSLRPDIFALFMRFEDWDGNGLLRIWMRVRVRARACYVINDRCMHYSPVASIHVRLSMIILHLASEVSAHGVVALFFELSLLALLMYLSSLYSFRVSHLKLISP